MATQVKIEFNSDGFKQILMSDGVKALVEGEAAKIQAKANANLNADSDGYVVNVLPGNYGGGRWVAHVQAADYAAAEAEAEDKTLTKAVR